MRILSALWARTRVVIDTGQGSTPGWQRAPHAAGLMMGSDVRTRSYPDGAVSTPRDADGTGPQDAAPAGGEHLSAHERIDDLARLGDLHRQGVLTDAEFAAEKARILDG